MYIASDASFDVIKILCCPVAVCGFVRTGHLGNTEEHRVRLGCSDFLPLTTDAVESPSPNGNRYPQHGEGSLVSAVSDVTYDVDGDERILTGYTGRISTILAAGWMATLLGRQVISPLLPTIIETLAITPSQAGASLTLMMGLYAVFQYPGGRFSDQLSRTTVLVVALSVMIAGFVLLTNALSYAVFLLGVAGVGTGAGLFFSPSRALLSDLFVERRGQVFGLHTAAGMVGGMLAAGIAATVLAVASWRAAFIPSIVLLGIVLVSLHRWSREPYRFARTSLDIAATSARLFASRRIRWLLIGYTLFGFVIQSFIGFLPTLLQVEKGFSPTLASVGFGLIYGVGLVVGPAAGRASDYLSRTMIVVSALLCGTLGLLVLLVAPSVALIFAGIVLTATGLWAYVPSIQAYLMDLLPNDSLGGDFGLLKAVYTGLGSAGPTYVGIVAERATYTIAFGGLAVCLLASAVIVFAATRIE